MLDTLDRGGNGNTSYDAAVAKATTAINSWTTADSGHENVVYFLSDGEANIGTISDGEENAWEATLAAKGFWAKKTLITVIFTNSEEWPWSGKVRAQRWAFWET